MLLSLSKSYKPFIQTLLIGKFTLKLDYMIVMLCENERSMRIKNSSLGDNTLDIEDSNRRMTEERDDDFKRKSKLKIKD